MKNYLQCPECNSYQLCYLSLELQKEDTRKNSYCLVGENFSINSNINYVINQKVKCFQCLNKYNFILKQHKGNIITELKPITCN